MQKTNNFEWDAHSKWSTRILFFSGFCKWRHFGNRSGKNDRNRL